MEASPPTAADYAFAAAQDAKRVADRALKVAQENAAIDEKVADRAARELVLDCMKYGWSVAYHRGKDSARNPFVRVEGSRNVHDSDDANQYFSVTWHTRATGTYRLFGHPVYGRFKWSAKPTNLATLRAIVKGAIPPPKG